MGSLRTPVGPLPSSIYWRRRAVVLFLIAVVVLLVAWALRSGGGGAEGTAGRDDGAGGPAESITPGPTPSESLSDERPGGREEEPSDGTGSTDDAGNGEGTGEEPGEGGDAGDADGGDGGGDTGGIDPASLESCAAPDITLSLRSDANEYAPGEEPKLRLTAQNSSEAACRLDFGHDTLALTLADAADERVWSWADCPTGDASDPRVVPAEGSVTHAVTWDRHRCEEPSGRRGTVDPGTYLAEAELAGYPVVRASFRLDED